MRYKIQSPTFNVLRHSDSIPGHSKVVKSLVTFCFKKVSFINGNLWTFRKLDDWGILLLYLLNL